MGAAQQADTPSGRYPPPMTTNIRRHWVACAIPLLLSLALPSLSHAATEGVDSTVSTTGTHRPALLVFTRTTGWRHDSIPQAVDALRALADQAGFDVIHSEDPAMFDDGMLPRFRAVVFANTTGDFLDDAQRAAFERYIAGG